MIDKLQVVGYIRAVQYGPVNDLGLVTTYVYFKAQRSFIVLGVQIDTQLINNVVTTNTQMIGYQYLVMLMKHK